MKLSDELERGNVILLQDGTTRWKAFEYILNRSDALRELSPEEKDSIVSSLIEREGRGSTLVGEGVAYPHCRSMSIPSKAIVVLAVSRDGVVWAEKTEENHAAHAIILIVSSLQDHTHTYIRLLASTIDLFCKKNLVAVLRRKNNEDAIYQAIVEADYD